MDTQRFSRIANGLKSASISSVTQTADALRREGKEVLVFSIGRPDFDTPEHIKAAANDALAKGFVHYTHNRGILPMREAVAAYLKRQNGLDYDPKTEIMITAGAQEALMLCTHALLDPGDEVLVPSPGFLLYYSSIPMLHAVPVPYVLKEPDYDWDGAPVSDRTKLMIFNNPNNPTGYLYTRREMNRIRDMVKKYDLFLFSDEVYREFIYTGSPYISACHLEGIEQNVVLIDSVSKRYSECGIRIGALITKNKTLRNAVMKFCQARLSPPLIGQIIAEASIDAPRSYSTEVYEEYIERRKCLIDGLNRIPGVYSPIPMGAFYTVARLPVDDSDKFCAWCLSDFEYEGETVMLAPASGFYSDPACGRNEVRIAYVLKKEDLERALVVLGKALEAYNNRK